MTDFDLDRECKAALERLHRSVGQKARWAKRDIRRKVLSHLIEVAG